MIPIQSVRIEHGAQDEEAGYESFKLFNKSIVCAALVVWNMSFSQAQLIPVPGDPLSGSGNVVRTALTYDNLFSNNYGLTPLDDTKGFGLPGNAAQPAEFFEGTLTLGHLTNNRFKEISDIFNLIPNGDSAWKHLAAFSFQFVQNGSHIIPTQQGLVYTGNAAWNYIVGPGRVWSENSDKGYMRAAIPFSLIQRNQNCVHNGELTFLFSSTKSPNISNVYYQITQETCYPMKFDEWGMLTAAYRPAAVANATAIKDAHAVEAANRMSTKPYDGWVPETTRVLAWLGAEVIVHPTMTNTIDRGQELILARANAIANQCYFVDVNAVGQLGNGQSIAVGPEGEVLHHSSIVGEQIPLTIDLNRVREVRRSGTLRLGQILKSFRDTPIEFPCYRGAYKESPSMLALGPLRMPKR